MSKKAKVPESEGGETAPFWFISYADMVTVLMGFFLLMYSLSTIEITKFQAGAASLHESFGGGFVAGGAGHLPIGAGAGTGNSPYDKTSYWELIGGKFMGQSVSEQRGQLGPYGRVTTVREGDRTVAGGRIGFAHGSADLSAEAKQGLQEVVDLVRGTPNKIEVRGHAAHETLPPGSPWHDAWDLAYARARAVADFLTKHDIAPQRLRVVSCGDQEPLQELYPTGDRWRDRRVEVMMMEATPDQFVREAAPSTISVSTSGGSNRG